MMKEKLSNSKPGLNLSYFDQGENKVYQPDFKDDFLVVQKKNEEVSKRGDFPQEKETKHGLKTLGNPSLSL